MLFAPPTSHRARLAILLVGLLALMLPQFAVAQTTWPDQDAIDLDNCTATANGTALPVEPRQILGALGYEGFQGDRGWQAMAPQRDDQGASVIFTLVFKAPLPLGTVQAGEVSNIDIQLAGTDDWQPAARLPRTPGSLYTALLPPGSLVRAVRFTQEQGRNGPNGLDVIVLHRERLFNITPLATANALSFFTEHHQFSPPTVFSPARVVAGDNAWVSAGLGAGDDHISSPPICEATPTWFVLSWKDPQSIQALYLNGNVTAFNLYEYTGPEGVNPSVTTDADWLKLRGWIDAPSWKGRNRGDRLILFATPVKSRGLKLVINGVSPWGNPPTDQTAAIYALNAYTALGDAAPPEMPGDATPPPFTIPYELAKPGYVSLVINGPDGRRVRNLFARHSQTAGKQNASWDLQDEFGKIVPPGDYRWEIVTGPPITPVYEMTPYPNVENFHPENSPWRNGHSGTGGWMADHSPSMCVATFGDRVYLGAPICESGEALIETDLTGKRLWGYGNLAAWVGAEKLAATETTLFAGTGQDSVYAVDRESKRVDAILTPSSTNERRRGMVGLAADARHLYMAVNARADWTANAASAADVDIDACTPRYAQMRKSNQAWSPDPQTEFLRLFRLTATPPGQDGALIALESSSMPDPRQHIVLAFKHPVAIGSLVFPFPKGDYTVRFSTFKPDATWPPDPYKDDQWTVFHSATAGDWTVIPAPPETSTRALRITFDKTVDAFDTALEGLGVEQPTWVAHLDGMKILRRRFQNLTPDATIRVNSGTLQENGEWDAQRDRSLTTVDPGIYMMEWKNEQSVRGLAIKEIDGKKTEIDVYTGPAGEINMTGDTYWKHVATYEQARRFYYDPDSMRNFKAIYMDGYVDFGSTVFTRAIRLRVVEQWTTSEGGMDDLYGVRLDRGGMTRNPTRCRVYGVAALQYLGQEVPVDPMISQRLEVYDWQRSAEGAVTATLQREYPLPDAGKLTLDPAGNLVGVVNGQVCAFDLATGKTRAITDDLLLPDGMAFDARGQLYVFDRGEGRQNVRVYDATGKYLRSVGKPGGIKMGPWDPETIGHGTWTGVDLAIDSTDQLWVVAAHDTPKRVSVWQASTGAFIREHLGNTSYGGGGVLNRWDTRQVFYNTGHSTLEFALDWQTGHTALKNILWTGPDSGGELPIRIDDRLYLVTRPMFGGQGCGLVYLYEGDHLRPVAGVGLASNFRALRTPAIESSLGNRPLSDMQFIWSDTNGDGLPTPDEVQFSPATIKSLSWFDHSLGIQAGAARYEVTSYLPNGAPVYAFKPEPGLPAQAGLRLDSGETVFFLNSEDWSGKAAYVDGKERWYYHHEGYGVHAISSAADLNPEQAVSEFDIIGFEPHPGLGEVFVTNSNIGRWNVWTHDGILAGEVMTDRRAPNLLSWSMDAIPRGTPMPGLTSGGEHFGGQFTRDLATGKYYLVAGHNHISILQLDGLADYTRLSGHLTVTPDAVRLAADWQQQRQAEATYALAQVYQAIPGATSLYTDQKEEPPPSTEVDGIRFNLVYGANALRATWNVAFHGPFLNQGEDWRRLFKTGAAVDLQLQTDPTAEPGRTDPAPGDIRLLIAPYRGKPVAVLYQPVAPGAAPTEAWSTHTSVYESSFDRVVRLDDVKIATSTYAEGYVVVAEIHYSAIGFTPKEGNRVRFDWGVLTTGPKGVEVLRRIYWANRATEIISDEAAEARIDPRQWGYLIFAPKPTLEFSTGSSVLSGEGPNLDNEALLDALQGDH